MCSELIVIFGNNTSPEHPNYCISTWFRDILKSIVHCGDYFSTPGYNLKRYDLFLKYLESTPSLIWRHFCIRRNCDWVIIEPHQPMSAFHHNFTKINFNTLEEKIVFQKYTSNGLLARRFFPFTAGFLKIW